jgi:hypothetical protein
MSCKSFVNRQFVRAAILVIAAIILPGCGPEQNTKAAREASTARIKALNLRDLVSPTAVDSPVSLAAAKNEWTCFQLQVSGLPDMGEKVAYTLRLQPLNLQSANSTISTDHFRAYQIMAMPVDVNRAGYVRHTGLTAATRLLPRALIPMPVSDGKVNLSAARDPNKPTDASSRAGVSPVMLWVDLHIPPEARAGAYVGTCDVLMTGVDEPIASVPVNLNVYDFVLPDERHLNLVGQIEWDSLTRLYQNRFEAVTPRFMTRGDDRYAAAITTLDQLVTMAQAHRVQVVVPRLQPNVKWPGGRPPQVTWAEFDSVVSPWLKGDMFADKVPLGFWPLPATDGLFNYDPSSQRQYWAEAATHFDQNDWLARSPVFLEKVTPGRATPIESIKLSSEAASVLRAHTRVRVAVPLEDDQIQFANDGNQSLIRPDDSGRVLTANPPIVFSSPIQGWPSGVARPDRWLRTDLTGVIPYVGAGGDERDVRLWAWLSFLPLPPPQFGVRYGPVRFIYWSGALPRNSSADQAADPNELIWFYPGSWFGLDEPVPTIQLKWLRRAQQDFEYLFLAQQRGDMLNALVMSRLMAKPVEIQPAQHPDQTYGLMCGTADPQAWEQVIDLLAKRILLREPGQPVDKDKDYKLGIETLQWSYPQERPVMLGRTTLWGWERRQGGENWINLRLGLDIYNASDSRPEDNTLGWTNVPSPSGWQMRPQPIPIPSLATFQVRRVHMLANVDPLKLNKIDRRPVELTFVNGHNKKPSTLRMILPVSVSDRREGNLDINDGSLGDWSMDDAIQNGPMLRMLNRPALQAQKLEPASTPAQIFTGWADANFYVAFKLSGLSQSPVKTARNFVDYQFRRAWGEDLCQVLIQPIYADNSTGPILHVACKPNGGEWTERKLDPRMYADPWQPLVSAGVRYVATPDGTDWRGEVAIPWDAINEAGKGMPIMLRFNFIHHRQETGESSSWAGPIDFGRDDTFTGILLLREPENPGMLRTANTPR